MWIFRKLLNMKTILFIISVIFLFGFFSCIFLSNWEITDAEVRIYAKVGDEDAPSGGWSLDLPEYLNASSIVSSVDPEIIEIHSVSANRLLVNRRGIIPSESTITIHISNISVLGNLTFNLVEQDLDAKDFSWGFTESPENHLILSINAETPFGKIDYYTMHKSSYENENHVFYKIRTWYFGIGFFILLSLFSVGILVYVFEYPKLRFPFITFIVSLVLVGFYIWFDMGQDFLFNPQYQTIIHQIFYRVIHFIPQIAGYSHIVGNLVYWNIIGLLIELWIRNRKIFGLVFTFEILFTILTRGYGLSFITLSLIILGSFEVVKNQKEYFSGKNRVKNLVLFLILGILLGITYFSWFNNILLDGQRLSEWTLRQTYLHILWGLISFGIGYYNYRKISKENK